MVSDARVATSIVALFYGALVACGPPAGEREASPGGSQATSGDAWYSGGTLHRSTISEWRLATPQNKLATSADFAAKILEPTAIEQVREPAKLLVQCIDSAAQVAPASYQTSEVAVACIVVMGWRRGSR